MSAVGLRVLFAALLASAAFAQTISDVCGQTFKVGDLVFTLPSSGTDVPSYLYWNVADSATRYQIAMSNISAFNSSDQSFSFANTTFSSWTWNWDCSLSCTNVSDPTAVSISNVTFGGLVNSTISPLTSNNTNIPTNASDMCFFIYNGSNGQTGNLSMSVTLITTVFLEKNGTGVLKFSVRLNGPLVATMLQQTDILLLDFNYSCSSSGNFTNCSDVNPIGNVRADIAGNHSRSVFTLVNHTVALNGPNVAPCSLIAGSGTGSNTTTANTCGLNSFEISAEDNVTVVSFEWNTAQIVGFDSIFIDPRIYTLASNVTGNGTTPTPTPTPAPTPVKPSFSRCFCDLTAANVTDALLNMTHLWKDHVLYTRLAIEQVIFNRTSLSNATLTRLYQNQDDLGDNFGILYCQSNGKQYASILRRHIDAAVGVLVAILNNSNVTEPTNVALANALEFAQFWHAVNPFFASTDDVFNHMSEHIATLAVLMQDLIAQNGTAVVTQQDIYSQATTNMVQYLIQGFQFQKQLSCSNKNQCSQCISC